MGSFDGGWGRLLHGTLGRPEKARGSGSCAVNTMPKSARMGLVNTVVPLAELERETVRWCREILQHSPMALRCLKSRTQCRL